MNRQMILVVDDESDIQELIRYNLKKEGFAVHTVGTGEEALKSAADLHPDAIILDLMLPGIEGTRVCTRLKEDPATRDIPVIMLTARAEETDIVAGLDIGADDYVTKPFSPKVLIARIRAALRKSRVPEQPVQTEKLSAHGIRMDLSRYEVYVEDRQISLSATEFAILEFFMYNPGWVFSRNKIIDAVRGKDYPVTERAVDVQILGLRKKLGTHGKLIETVRGVGYRLKAI
jgi:two-component system, OmpR family, alkaline phosphatase synthesis response regulator PhoP